MFITFGVIVLLFCAYELWGTGLYTQRQQESLQASLRERWQPSADSSNDKIDLANASFHYNPLALGQTFGVLRIPELGRDYQYAIVQGAGPEQLKKGPGHFRGDDGTAMPGQRGNFVVSGHRTTYSAPFREIDELEHGDPIVVETGQTWFVYRVYDKAVVDPSAVEVAAPVPFHPNRRATKRRITLTTCHPMYTARQRLIVFGELARARPKGIGPPPALTEV